MKNFKASIDIMPHDNLLDPQGKAVSSRMKDMGLSGIEGVRIGKHITLKVSAADEAKAKELVEDACKRLLANQVMERFSFELEAC